MTDAPIRTEPRPACPACGGDGPVAHDVADRLYGSPGRWTARECRTCRSLWLDPRPVDDDLGRCYPATYFTHGEDVPPPAPLHGVRGRLRRHVVATLHGYRFPEGPSGPTALGRALAAVPPVRHRATSGLGPLLFDRLDGGRLLDIGCGNGAYLAQMRAYGWDVTGQEIDADAAAAARARGIEVVSEPLEELAEREPGFDVVTGSHVLEHVTDAAAFLDAALRCLRPGGRLVMVTPNAGALGRRLLGDDWYPLDPPRHLAVYSPQGVERLAARLSTPAAVEVSSLSRSSAKTLRMAAQVRRDGRFRGGPPPSRVADAAAQLFALVERLAVARWTVGEELVLLAERQP